MSDTMTEQQGAEIISLSQKILKELKEINEQSASLGHIHTELCALNSKSTDRRS